MCRLAVFGNWKFTTLVFIPERAHQYQCEVRADGVKDSRALRHHRATKRAYYKLERGEHSTSRESAAPATATSTDGARIKNLKKHTQILSMFCLALFVPWVDHTDAWVRRHQHQNIQAMAQSNSPQQIHAVGNPKTRDFFEHKFRKLFHSRCQASLKPTKAHVAKLGNDPY